MSFKPFALRGVVVHGHGRGGTKLGFPTANVQLTDHVTEELKRYTNLVVYGWGCVMESGEESENSGTSKGPYPIAMSIGFNPHFHDKALTAEVHFLHEFGQDFYGAVVKVVVVGVVREMGAFVSLEALVDAIKSDVQYTTEVLQKQELERYKEHPFLAPQLMPSETLPHFELLTGRNISAVPEKLN